MNDLTPKMRDALESIHRTRAAWVSTETDVDDGEAFVHWATAKGLERRRLVSIVNRNEIRIIPEGLSDLLTEDTE